MGVCRLGCVKAGMCEAARWKWLLGVAGPSKLFKSTSCIGLHSPLPTPAPHTRSERTRPPHLQPNEPRDKLHRLQHARGEVKRHLLKRLVQEEDLREEALALEHGVQLLHTRKLRVQEESQ
eukprot:363986-Chlamydomonas_euryale.AAC.17